MLALLLAAAAAAAAAPPARAAEQATLTLHLPNGIDMQCAAPLAGFSAPLPAGGVTRQLVFTQVDASCRMPVTSLGILGAADTIMVAPRGRCPMHDKVQQLIGAGAAAVVVSFAGEGELRERPFGSGIEREPEGAYLAVSRPVVLLSNGDSALLRNYTSRHGELGGTLRVAPRAAAGFELGGAGWWAGAPAVGGAVLLAACARRSRRRRAAL